MLPLNINRKPYIRSWMPPLTFGVEWPWKVKVKVTLILKLISRKRTELGPMLLLTINRKPYMGSPLTSSHLALSDPVRSKPRSLRSFLVLKPIHRLEKHDSWGWGWGVGATRWITGSENCGIRKPIWNQVWGGGGSGYVHWCRRSVLKNWTSSNTTNDPRLTLQSYKVTHKYTVKPVFKTTWEIGTPWELRTASVRSRIQYMEMDLRNKTTPEFRTLFPSPLGVHNSQVSLYINWHLWLLNFVQFYFTTSHFQKIFAIIFHGAQCYFSQSL